MVDPLTALSVASAAVSQMRNLINAGRDTSAAMSKFAGAWSDLNEAERRAKNPPWYQSFSGSMEQRAADAFAAKKKGEALKKELENMIRFVHGPTGLDEYKNILRDMRDQKRKSEYRKAEIKEAIIHWIVGILVGLGAIGILGTVLYFIGLDQGRW